MRDSKLSRRDMLRASTALAASAVFAEPLAAAAPEPTPLSPAMIQAARKEGTLAFYTAMEIPLAEGLSKSFEAKYSGIKVRLKRSGAERVFQRIGKEEEIRIHEVDVVCSTDAGHFVRWQREGLLAPFLPEEAAKHLPPEQIGADGMYATAFASLSPIGYAAWAGPISRGSPNKRSCSCSHRATHRTGSPAARVPCKLTGPIPSSCCCESVVRRWKLSTLARARR
jgi:iron(III) transport system substrate-binding protein